LREEDGTAVGGTDTEHAGWRSQTRNASIAKPGKVGRWRAGKRGNEPSFASDGQRGEAAAVRGIKTDGSRGGPTEAATELLPPTRSPLGARSARNLAAGQCSALPFPLQRNPAPLFYFPHAQPGCRLLRRVRGFSVRFCRRRA